MLDRCPVALVEEAEIVVGKGKSVVISYVHPADVLARQLEGEWGVVAWGQNVSQQRCMLCCHHDVTGHVC